MPDSRQVLVPPERLQGWVERFGQRNGSVTAEQRGAVVVLQAVNGCTAELTPALTGTGGTAANANSVSLTVQDAVDALLLSTEPPVTVGLLLIRRGGYAAGVSRGGVLLASKTGTKYVQSRTAAGGWSQQRFARRRANQADGLVETAAERAGAIFGDHRLDCLQTGGDSQLISACLSHTRLAHYARLPLLPVLTVPDPRLDILRKAALDAVAVRVSITGIPDN